MASPSMLLRISLLSSPISSRSSTFRSDKLSSNSLIDDVSPTLLLKASAEIQKPSGTRIPSILEISPGSRPCPQQPGVCFCQHPENQPQRNSYVLLGQIDRGRRRTSSGDAHRMRSGAADSTARY